MDINFEEISENMRKIQEKWRKPEQVVPPQEEPKSIDDEVTDELLSSKYSDLSADIKFLTKCFKYLKRLGYLKSQYDFSEQFLNKNKYYFGMILSEGRQPSIDCVHNLIHNISNLNDGLNKRFYLDRLYEEGQDILTKRLLKYL